MNLKSVQLSIWILSKKKINHKKLNIVIYARKIRSILIKMPSVICQIKLILTLIILQRTSVRIIIDRNRILTKFNHFIHKSRIWILIIYFNNVLMILISIQINIILI